MLLSANAKRAPASHMGGGGAVPRNAPKSKDRIARTRNTKQKILAASYATPATMPKPKSPAIKAMIKNSTASLNMMGTPLLLESAPLAQQRACEAQRSIPDLVE